MITQRTDPNALSLLEVDYYAPRVGTVRHHRLAKPLHVFLIQIGENMMLETPRPFAWDDLDRTLSSTVRLEHEGAHALIDIPVIPEDGMQVER
ncbi:hypothetical protein QFZ82_000165 [Streptomyces sp. V4I23]|nr:hypothetical protein [Streptomyces sp. V4I23]